MTTLGVFTDGFYNLTGVLPSSIYYSTSQTSGTIPAAKLTGAQEVYLASSGATALTTDSAANIIAAVSASIASAVNSNSNLSYSPSSVVGLSWDIQINNANAGTLTLSAGTGVTITGTATIATVNARQYVVTITSPTTVTFQNVGGGAWA